VAETKRKIFRLVSATD